MASYRLTKTADRQNWLDRYPRLTEHQVKTVADSLVDALGSETVITDRDQLLAYSYDATGERHWPDMVVLPGSVGEVQTALELAHRYHLPVVGRGASTNLSGGTTPLVGGMVMSFARLNHILDINWEARWCRVEPGVVNADLAEALRRGGFFYPPDPSSHRISTIGGNLAENAGGPHCVKYGVTTHHALQLQIALADGRIVDLPAIGEAGGGVDLASLVVGSEGTLGLVTEAVLAIQPLPEANQTALASFATLEDAVRAVTRIVAARIQPSAVELMDRESIRVVEAFVHAGYPADAEAVLLIEVDGAGPDIEPKMRAVRGLCEAAGAIAFQVAKTSHEAETLWRGRRAHYGAAARLAPRLWVQDVTVPRPRLVEMINRVTAIGARENLLIVTAAHAGDGNLHPNIPYDPNNAVQVKHLKAADRAILQACVELGGSITGEHGVGIDKAEHLPLMYSPWELEVLNQVKNAFDPTGVLNPLKAVWPPGALPSTVVPAERPVRPDTVGLLQDAMRWSMAHSEPLSIRGSGRRSNAALTHWVLDMRAFDALYDLDIENLSVEVGAGMKAGALARMLAAEGLEVPGAEPFMDDTIGGLVASNAAFWRQGEGHGWRDWVLAAEWVDGRGRLLKFGRKTMKNVAGYDVAKIMVGSQGRIGAMTRLTLKVQPRSRAVAVAQGALMPVSQALAAAAAILSSPDRPEGVAVVKQSGQKEAAVWCVGNLTYSRQRQYLLDQLGDVAFSDGEDAWLSLEKDRLHQVYQAVSQGRYYGGRLPLESLAAAQDLLQGAAAVYFYAGNRRYEMMGDKDAALPLRRHPEVARLWERVMRIFDPEQLLQ